VRWGARIGKATVPLVVLVAGCVVGSATATAAQRLPPSWTEFLRPLETFSRTGVIYDRVVPIARLERFDGSPAAPRIGLATWRQAYDELRRASLAPDGPDLAALDEAARHARREGVIPLVWLDREYERIRPGALADGSIRIVDGRLDPVGREPLVASRAVAAAALVPRTFRGGEVVFDLATQRFLSDDPHASRSVAIDFADGRGLRTIALDQRVQVRYATPGLRTLCARITRSDGSIAESRFTFDVAALGTPTPDDTLHIAATVPYQGQFGTGEAYVYLAPGHSALTNPIVVIEGFDLDNHMGWDELYALLNGESLLETLRAEGFDAVVLNFTDATAAIEQNGFVVAELVLEVQDLVPPQATLALVGASMGGLCSRYALAYLESSAIPHRVRTWISFDAPHSGAIIPLGLQYWVEFFSGMSADAAAFLAILDRPAAREMLTYHYTVPAGTTGEHDPMRDALLAAFSSVGDYPSLPRRVAIANGSGAMTNQGFLPGAPLIQYEYSSALFAVVGNVWAVPDVAATTVFDGSLRILFSTTTETVTVSNTAPWDGAPGGSRASLAQLDSTAAPEGDIVALHPSHCFIPTVSALALPTGDPFFDVAGQPDLVSLTPFDAVYYPAENQEHVQITPENAAWLRSEIETGVVSVPRGELPREPVRVTLSAAPNPARRSVRLDYTLPGPAEVDLQVFDIHGRRVRALATGWRAGGSHLRTWDGRNEADARVSPGVYLVRLDVDGSALVRRVVFLD